jgi:hypothetical protein
MRGLPVVFVLFVVLSAAALAGVGCDSGNLRTPDPGPFDGPACIWSDRISTEGKLKLDLLFVVDDSPAMANVQVKLERDLPRFLGGISDVTPDLHVAVVSSSLGGGRFNDVPGCESGGPGDQDGRFSHPEGSGLFPGETFMRFNGAPLNFQKDAGAVFSRLARLGHAGCAYPQPLAAARRALTKAQDPADPHNAGFLRPEAALGVVIVTTEDDCSVPADSDLFDPRQMTLADPYGGQGTYRCAEFGWLCDGVKPPHDLAASSDRVDLGACVPAETTGKLTPISEFIQFLKGLKSNPDNIMVSLVTGPVRPTEIGHRISNPGSGVLDGGPVLGSSCAGADGETAMPGIRLKALADSFGANGVFLPSCANDLAIVTMLFGESIRLKQEPLCVPPAVTEVSATNCHVTQTQLDENGVESRWEVPACDADRTVVPCWRLNVNAAACVKGSPLRICRDVSCAFDLGADEALTMDVSCLARCH